MIILVQLRRHFRAGMTGWARAVQLYVPVPAINWALLYSALILSSANADAAEGQQRLSEWLSTQTITAGDYPLGLMWLVPGEEAVQSRLRSDLLKAISGSKGDTKTLHEWITALPVTGRVPVSIVDAGWLRANPDHDPVILPSHRVILPKRPRTVTLITSKGERCQLPHVPGRMARQYLAACVPPARQVDWFWLVQPDGKVRRFGIAIWNAQKQDEPAPGAWLWMPYRDDKWADALSGKLAAFLATQGVAPEPAGGGVEIGGSFMNMESGDGHFADPVVTANDWGGAGLLQSPTARMQVTGHASMTLSRAYPYSRINFFMQPFDWMEVGFRYTSVSNQLYGPSIAGNQAYKDKSLDVKFGLFDESAYLPQVALGLRDVTGTGLFSGEFIVANKRTGPLDWSLGMGWGYVGGRGNLHNPLAGISRTFETRKQDVGMGGNLAVSSYFRGPTALFGGVQYQSPWERLILKLEYDGNDYQHEPFNSNLRQDSPWNAGAVYRAWPAVDVTLGFERGNTLTLSLTLQADLKKMATPKLDDPAPVAVAEYRPQESAIGDATAHDLADQTGWAVRSITQHGNELRVYFDDAEAVYWRERLDRANAVLHRDAAAEVGRFSFAQRQHGMELVEHQVDREVWVRQQTQPVPPGEQRDPFVTRAVNQTRSTGEHPIYPGERSMLETEPGVGLRYNLGGPDSFILYQIFAEERAKLRLRDDTWLQGSLQLGLLDNYDKFKYTASSDLPRVRTYMREYLTSSKITMPNLQLANAGKLSENQYYSVYAGYLEMMYAGVGAEWLYRSLGSHVALGVDINKVRQRDFRQDFALRQYQTSTGHATVYWDTGWNDVLANLSAGRYLAGDVGVTVELSRVFQNGVRFGGYFTKTNVSARQFGEGSFDKALYVDIPFDVMLTKSSSKAAHFIWKPLIRDGGARLDREVRLYDMTQLLDERTLQYRPADLENHIPIPSQRQQMWEDDIHQPE